MLCISKGSPFQFILLLSMWILLVYMDLGQNLRKTVRTINLNIFVRTFPRRMCDGFNDCHMMLLPANNIYKKSCTFRYNKDNERDRWCANFSCVNYIYTLSFLANGQRIRWGLTKNEGLADGGVVRGRRRSTNGNPFCLQRFWHL